MNGAEFLERFSAEFEADGPHTQAAVQSVAEHLDTIAALEQQVERDGLMIQGSREQLVLHPAIAELRHARLALSRLLKELGIDDGDISASQGAAALNRKRWAAS